MTTTDLHRPDDEERRDGGRRALALGAVAAAAAVGFGVLNAAAVRRDTARADHKVRRAMAPPEGHPARRVAEALAPVGKWYTYIPTALAASAGVLAAPGRSEPGALRSRAIGAGAVVLAGTAATILNPAFDRWLPQPPAPPGHESRRKPVFPSGHAFGPGAVSFSAAYVLAREEIVGPAAAVPAALAIPLVAAGARVLVEKHWASDVIGGMLGGAALAAACLAGYEAAARR